jgi:hypothetical protein
VNARTGVLGNNGLTATTAFPSVRTAFATMVPVAAGAFHTLRVAGTYAPGTAQALLHDDLREGWSANGPLVMPPWIQLVYDDLNSDKDASAGYAPVIFDGTGTPAAPLVLFNATAQEPSSRIDGANPSVATNGYSNAFLHFRNAPVAVRIAPPPSAPLSGPPVGSVPPGAAFRRLRWENCAVGLEVIAKQSAATPPFSFTMTPVIEECLFTGGSTVGSKHLYVEAWEEGNTNGYYNPAPTFTVRDCRLELGPGGGPGNYAYGIRVLSRALSHGSPTGILAGLGGSSASVVGLIERTEILGSGSGSPTRQRGIDVLAVHFLGNANLIVRNCNIHDTGSTGVAFEKLDEGASFLTLEGTTVERCGLSATGDPFDDSGVAVRATHNIAASGYSAPSTMMATRLSGAKLRANRLHGLYLHTPRVGNAEQAVLFGTDLSLVLERNQIFENGYVGTEPVARDGSGVLVHLEQGNLIGLSSPILSGPPSLLLANDIYRNALHGVEFRGASSAPATDFSIAFHGTVVNNLIDQNGYPWYSGPAIESNELRCSLDGSNLSGSYAAVSALQLTQNTFYDGVDYPTVHFAVAGAGNEAHWSAGLRGNLAVRTDIQPSTPSTFVGFAGSSAPYLINVLANLGTFDNAVHYGARCNTTSTEANSFVPGLGGDFVDPDARDYQLNLRIAPAPPNPALDRVYFDSSMVGQQPIDKVVAPRNVAVLGVPNCLDNRSDCGALEKQL